MVFSQCSHTSTSQSCLQPQHSPLILPPPPPPPLPLPGIPPLLWVAPTPFCEGEKYLRRPECPATGSLGGEGAVRSEALSLVGLAPRNSRAFVLSVGTHRDTLRESPVTHTSRELTVHFLPLLLRGHLIEAHVHLALERSNLTERVPSLRHGFPARLAPSKTHAHVRRVNYAHALTRLLHNVRAVILFCTGPVADKWLLESHPHCTYDWS